MLRINNDKSERSERHFRDEIAENERVTRIRKSHSRCNLLNQQHVKMCTFRLTDSKKNSKSIKKYYCQDGNLHSRASTREGSARGIAVYSGVSDAENENVKMLASQGRNRKEQMKSRDGK